MVWLETGVSLLDEDVQPLLCAICSFLTTDKSR